MQHIPSIGGGGAAPFQPQHVLLSLIKCFSESQVDYLQDGAFTRRTYVYPQWIFFIKHIESIIVLALAVWF